jgi:cell division transport system ATP-binding protein
MIKFERVSKCYTGGFQGLSEVSFEMAAGEIAFLTGHSGAGKSTLLKLMMLMERPSQGQVFINGQNLRNVGRTKIPFLRRQIGVVFQNHQLLFDRSVFDNVALPLVISGCPHHEIGRRVRAALDKVGLLNKERNNPITLSGGEQQRVGIARAVVNKPPVLLADEPTGNLDPQLATEIMNLFRQFNQVGVTVLIASHDIALIKSLPYPIMSLKQGHVVRQPATQAEVPFDG